MSPTWTSLKYIRYILQTFGVMSPNLTMFKFSFAAFLATAWLKKAHNSESEIWNSEILQLRYFYLNLFILIWSQN